MSGLVGKYICIKFKECESKTCGARKPHSARRWCGDKRKCDYFFKDGVRYVVVIKCRRIEKTDLPWLVMKRLAGED